MSTLVTQHLSRYGGYDGYNVFNDVAILNTDTWAWEVKSTTANVQGRADVSFAFQILVLPKMKPKEID
jgi:hypothetical protein